MKCKLPLLALLLVAASAYATDAQVYKWTDAGGVVHYTDAPPPLDTKDVQTVRVRGGDRPHAVGNENTETAGKAADAEAAKPAEPPQATPVADTADNRAKACDLARNNLELLQSKFPVSVAGSNGKAQELDDKGRQGQIADANAQITLYCK